MSKWSRNTSAVQSANASASTLALEQTHLHTRVEAVRVHTDEDIDASLEDTTLAHVNVHDLASADDDAKTEVAKPSVTNIAATTAAPDEDPMDSRFKFPPVESFPPPPPLIKRNPANNSRPGNRKAMAFANESETSLASVDEGREENESADDADRGISFVRSVLLPDVQDLLLFDRIHRAS